MQCNSTRGPCVRPPRATHQLHNALRRVIVSNRQCVSASLDSDADRVYGLSTLSEIANLIAASAKASAFRLRSTICCVPLSSRGEVSTRMSSMANLPWSMDGLPPTASQVHPLRDDNVRSHSLHATHAVRPQAIGEPGVASWMWRHQLERVYNSLITVDLAWLQGPMQLLLASTSVRRCTPLSQPPNEVRFIEALKLGRRASHEYPHDANTGTKPCAITGWDPVKCSPTMALHRSC